MNLELTDEQKLLREAAADALTRLGTIAAARGALDGAALPDLWATARTAGWTGLLVAEEHGGAGLGLFDAMVVAEECGRRLSGAGLLGHLAACSALAAGGDEALGALAAGEQRAATVFARPRGAPVGWTTESPGGDARDAPLPRAVIGDDGLRLTGAAGFVPDLPGADLVVVPAVTAGGELVVGVVEPGAAGVTVEQANSYDASRTLGHLRLDDAPARRAATGAPDMQTAWHDAQALLAADALGVAEAVLEMAVAYAKERHTFGRPIGSYQAIKQQLVEMLRLTDRARSLCVAVGLAESATPHELPLACASARFAAEQAAGYGTRTNIAVHGGIGATWEHDAPLFWRRAQLSRILLGGEAAALDRIADEFIDRARDRAAAAA